MRRYLVFGVSAVSLATFSILIASAQDADDPLAAAAGAPGKTIVITGAPGEGGGLVFREGPGEHREPDDETVALMEQDGELGAQVAALAAQIKDLSEADRADAERRLADLVAQQFAVRQSLRERELAQLEAQVARLRGLHQQRAEQKDRIVADRVEQLLREAEGLGWGDASAVGVRRKFELRTGASPWVLPRLEPPVFERRRRVIVEAGAVEAAAEAAVGEAFEADAEE